MQKEQNQFFVDLARRFGGEGIECDVPEDERLVLKFDGQAVGFVTPGGGVRIKEKYLDEPEVNELYHRVAELAAEVREYRTLMEAAPPLKAMSLDAPYRLLADFGGYVLGGMDSRYGTQFTTWEWTYNRTGLTLGHYFENNYAAAKRDFAIRAGLVQEDKKFSSEQLLEIYRCCDHTQTTDDSLSYEREAQINSIQAMISEMVPELVQEYQDSQELAYWRAVTTSSENRWIEDSVTQHNGKGSLYYTGGEDGQYMRISPEGELTVGSYHGAYPHIGEALFLPQQTQQYESYEKAFQAACEYAGAQFLEDMLSSDEPVERLHSPHEDGGPTFEMKF